MIFRQKHKNFQDKKLEYIGLKNSRIAENAKIMQSEPEQFETCNNCGKLRKNCFSRSRLPTKQYQNPRKNASFVASRNWGPIEWPVYCPDTAGS